MFVDIFLKALFLCMLLVSLQTEGKHFNNKSNRGKYRGKVNQVNHSKSRVRLKKLHKSTNKHIELGHRRQFTPSDGISPVNTLPQQFDNSLNAIISQDGPLPNPGILNQLHGDNLPIPRQHFAGPSILPGGVPVEIKTPLPIPFAKPDIKVVPKLFPLRYTNKPDINVQHIHIEQGVNPCQNGGLVVHSPGGYSCLCRKAYRGKHCQEKDKCFPNPCRNGGNCMDLATHLQCACAKGFKGLRCEESSTCDKNPCKHGATCLDLPSGMRCLCPEGYKGQYCAELDFCNPNPCKNDGTCTEKNLAPVCSCKREYKGARCEAEKLCHPNRCRNNGVCYEDKSSAPCQCAPGFMGQYCTEHVCKPNPCLNGGVCSYQKSVISSAWTPICKCPNTFKGDKCEIPNPCEGNPNPCQHGVCFDAFNGHRMDVIADHYVCNCYRGYMGQKCDVRACDKCDTHAKCLNDECVCNDGYYGNGHVCKKLPDPCIPNPCKNFGKCVPFESSYDCLCPFSFVGERCEQQL